MAAFQRQIALAMANQCALTDGSSNPQAGPPVESRFASNEIGNVSPNSFQWIKTPLAKLLAIIPPPNISFCHQIVIYI
jgi:hypothetical protein